MLTLVQASPVRNQINNFNVNDLNSSQQFFKTGRDKLEEEVQWLQTQEMPSKEIVQLKIAPIGERKIISLQEQIQGWCLNSEGNLILTDSYQSDIITEKDNPIIPHCY